MEQLRAARLTQITARAAAEAERDVSVHDVERLTSGEGVANDEALQSARQLRTEALAPIWEAHLAGAWTKRAEVRAKEVESADKAIAWTDQLADRHTAEAHRAAELAQAIKRCETAKAQTAAAERAIVEIDAELARRLLLSKRPSHMRPRFSPNFRPSKPRPSSARNSSIVQGLRERRSI